MFDHHIVALCLPPHTTHALEPLHVESSGRSLRLTRNLVTNARRGAIYIDNDQFLRIYQEARKGIPNNSRLSFLQPDKVLRTG